jgi:hypothetical protein
MRWTTGVGLAVGALGLSSCVYGYRTVSLAGRYSMDSRPEGSYYCYDCHGYRFFDPYYDYCSYNGFRYRWDDHPRAAALYRQRYVRIRQAHPEYGRYRYHEDYRASDRYREPASYDEWRRPESGESGAGTRGVDRREEGRRPGWKERKRQDEGKRERGKRPHEKERERGGGRPSSSSQGA